MSSPVALPLDESKSEVLNLDSKSVQTRKATGKPRISKSNLFYCDDQILRE